MFISVQFMNNRDLALASVLICLTTQAMSAEMDGIFRFESDKLTIEYYVPTARLRSRSNAWDPMKQPFPVDIQEYAIRARQHLEATRLLNGPVGISSIAIHHKTVATEGKLEEDRKSTRLNSSH